MPDLSPAGVVYAEANHGRWIAKCPRPDCTNALALDPGQTAFACVAQDGCGQTADVVWPPDPDAIETLLMLRPVPGTRNWLPGETLEQLLEENAAHGLIPAEWYALSDAAGGTLELLGTTDGVLTSGLLLEALPAGRPRPAIGA